MVPKTSNDHLLPARHPQEDLFICDIGDAVLKDVVQQMEHPFYSLSKKPETTVRRYEHGDHWLEITPSVKGLATIYDKDILIYAISQIMAKLNAGERVSPRVRMSSHEFLIFTNRDTGGKDYKAFVAGLERLRGTTISTNIRTGDEEQIDTFGLIDSSSVRRKEGVDGRLLWVEVTLSDWVFNAIRAGEVLTLNRAYFRLGRPYERRAYEIARKHCGRKADWRIGLALLKKKMGARSSLKKFRFFIRELAANDHLPDYQVEYDEETDQVVFRNRAEWWEKHQQRDPPPFRSLDTFEKAKRYTMGEDVYAWHEDWKEYWRQEGCPVLKTPDGAFIGFCKQRYVRKNAR